VKRFGGPGGVIQRVKGIRLSKHVSGDSRFSHEGFRTNIRLPALLLQPVRELDLA
jgi:hypothetical protein